MGLGPDFIGIGSQKCGTTWLAARLAEHPQICFYRKKEIGFFTDRFYRGYRWYNKRFRDKGDRLAGEFSTHYFLGSRPDSCRLAHYPNWSFQWWFKRIIRKYPDTRNEIKKHYPNVKIIAMFRNPADRAWSQYWKWCERRTKTNRHHLIVPFEKFFADNGRWVQLFGNYGTRLQYWRETFPNMGVFLYDDLVADPHSFLASVYRFLGVDDSFVGNIQNRENARKNEPMPDETRRMVLEFYRPEIELFYKLTGRKLNWLDGV